MSFDKTVVILGPTASGKTGVAIEIAKEIGSLSSQISSLEPASAPSQDAKSSSVRSSALPRTSSKLASPTGFAGFTGAEIISADSRAIYEEMDIGTAKPSLEEQDGVKHWGLDLVRPGERFTVADWKRYAEEKIREIRERGKLPMVVGGTGLYIDALVYGYDFSEEAKQSQSNRKNVCTNYLLIGVKTEPEVLRERIAMRANNLFVQELFEETRKLAEKYDWQTQAMKSNIYQFAWAYLQGEMSLEKAKELFIYDDWHLAKRQLTWFKRNKEIIWLELDKIRDYVVKCIQDEQRN